MRDGITVLLKPVHDVRQCVDKGSFLKMTSFRQLVFTRVLVNQFTLSNNRYAPLGQGNQVCAEAKTNRVS